MDNISVMAMLFAIVCLGFVAARLGYMGGEFDRRLSALVVDITSPALILSSTMGDSQPDRELILPLLAISVVSYIVLTGAAILLSRVLTHSESERGVIGFALLFGNVGFIGYPVVATLFGHEAVFYAAILNVVNTLRVFTVGRVLITGGRLRSSFRWRVLLSPSMVAAYLGMAIVALDISNVSHVVSTPLTMVGNITVPAALMIIGSSMGQLPLRQMLGNRLVFSVAMLRLFFLPVLLLPLCSALGFAPLVVSVNTVILAMPVATFGTIFCLRYGRDATLMTELTFITTLLSIATIPIVALLL